MKRTVASLFAALVLAATVSYSQRVVVLQGPQAVPAGGAITADDTQSTALLIRYVGTNAGGGEVTVEADGNLTFTVATVAYTGFECPVSAPLGGILDVSNAACDTLGEVCDIVNGVSPVATTDFRCVILDGTRADSANDSLLAMSISTADAKAGRPLFWDADTIILSASLALVPPEARSIDYYLGPAPNYALKRFPFYDTQTFVTWAWEDSATCTGADTFRIIGLNDYTYNGETPTFLYGPIATNTTTPVSFDFSHGTIFGKFGAKLVARETCATSFATGLLSVSAYQVPR